MVMHITDHSNIDCYVTHTAALQFFVKTCVALKFVNDDDDDGVIDECDWHSVCVCI